MTKHEAEKTRQHIKVRVGIRAGLSCPANVNSFCRATNVNTRCENGVLKSNAMDTCGNCTC